MQQYLLLSFTCCRWVGATCCTVRVCSASTLCASKSCPRCFCVVFNRNFCFGTVPLAELDGFQCICQVSWSCFVDSSAWSQHRSARRATNLVVDQTVDNMFHECLVDHLTSRKVIICQIRVNFGHSHDTLEKAKAPLVRRSFCTNFTLTQVVVDINRLRAIEILSH